MNDVAAADDVTRVAGSTAIELREAAAVAKVGQRLGRYLVIEEIGRGGMGVVLRAFDSKLQREVALKVVRKLSARAEARLIREARAMAMLSDSNVVALFDVGVDDNAAAGVGRQVTGKRHGVVALAHRVAGASLAP